MYIVFIQKSPKLLLKLFKNHQPRAHLWDAVAAEEHTGLPGSSGFLGLLELRCQGFKGFKGLAQGVSGFGLQSFAVLAEGLGLWAFRGWGSGFRARALGLRQSLN